MSVPHKDDLKRGVDFIGVTVPFVVHDGKGNVLLQKRSQNTRDEQGRWDVGGGSMEFGETFEEAVRREVREELCADAKKVTFLEVYNALRDNNGTQTHWIALVHCVQVDPAEVKIGEPERIDEIGWFKIDKLPSPLHSMMQQSLLAAKRAGII
jgi:ADP-ribose pyrophosphatase YjhB (NUDIX family)